MAFKAAQDDKSLILNLHNIGGGVPLVIKDFLTEVESKLLRAGANFGSLATIMQELASRGRNA